MQVAFLDSAESIISEPPSRNQLPAFYGGVLGLGNANNLQMLVATGGGTAFPAWARQTFPLLAQRLEVAAASATDQVTALQYPSSLQSVRFPAQVLRNPRISPGLF